MFLLPYSALLESKRHLCFSINDTNKILKSGSSLMVAWHVMWRWQKYEWLYVDAVQVTSNTHVTLRRSLSARFASDRGPARRGSLYVTAGKTCTTYTPIEKHLPPVSGLQAEARWERIDEIYYLSQIYAALLSNPPGAAPSTTRIFFSAQRFNLNNYNSSASIVIIIIIRIRMANEICGMWKQKAAQVIPIVISSTGVIPKSLSQNLSRLNLHPNTYIQLQKSVILGTCSIVRNFLNYK